MPQSMPNNKNAEKWTIDKSIEIFDLAMALSKEKDDYVIGSGQNTQKIEGFKYHFVGEVAAELGYYLDLFTYLRDKFPEITELYNKLKTRLEANCFSDSKKGIIKEATAIMNLKSNYGWTDRVQNETNLTTNIPILQNDPIK